MRTENVDLKEQVSLISENTKLQTLKGRMKKTNTK